MLSERAWKGNKEKQFGAPINHWRDREYNCSLAEGQIPCLVHKMLATSFPWLPCIQETWDNDCGLLMNRVLAIATKVVECDFEATGLRRVGASRVYIST